MNVWKVMVEATWLAEAWHSGAFRVAGAKSVPEDTVQQDQLPAPLLASLCSQSLRLPTLQLPTPHLVASNSNRTSARITRPLRAGVQRSQAV